MLIDALLPEITAAVRDHREPADGVPDPDGAAVLICSRYEGRSVWALFPAGGRRPAVIAKVDHRSYDSRRLHREREALLALAQRPPMRAFVPRFLGLIESGGCTVLLQSAVAGTPLSVRAKRRLRPSPRTSAREHDLVLAFLERLHDEVAEPLTFDPDVTVARARRALTRGGREAGRTVGALSKLRAGWTPLQVPVVRGHGDLSASNILLHGEHVRVIDWEGGAFERSAIFDLVKFLYRYALVQPWPSAPTRNAGSRLAGFQRAFVADDWLTTLSARTFVRYLSTLGLPVAAAEQLLVATVADLAVGTSPAHRKAGKQSRAVWTTALRSYLSRRGDTPIALLARRGRTA